MAKFDDKTVNFGRVEFTNCTVHVYSTYHDRRGLQIPGGRVVDARWVGRTVQVKMHTGWTYVFDGFGSYTESWK